MLTRSQDSSSFNQLKFFSRIRKSKLSQTGIISICKKFGAQHGARQEGDANRQYRQAPPRRLHHQARAARGGDSPNHMRGTLLHGFVLFLRWYTDSARTRRRIALMLSTRQAAEEALVSPSNRLVVSARQAADEALVAGVPTRRPRPARPAQYRLAARVVHPGGFGTCVPGAWTGHATQTTRRQRHCSPLSMGPGTRLWEYGLNVP